MSGNYYEDDYDSDDGAVLSSMKRLSVRRSFMGDADSHKAGGPKMGKKKAGSSGGSAPTPARAPAVVEKDGKVKFKKLEPKTFFANERTFLQWLNSSVQMVTLGVGLTTYSAVQTSGSGAATSAYTSGIVFAALGIIFMIYSVVIFRWRGNTLKAQRQGPYDDNIGPILLVLAMVGAVTFNFVYESQSV